MKCIDLLCSFHPENIDEYIEHLNERHPLYVSTDKGNMVFARIVSLRDPYTQYNYIS